jgi:hypothetical protein
MTTVTFTNAFTTVFATEDATALETTQAGNTPSFSLGLLASIGAWFAKPFSSTRADEICSLLRLADSLQYTDPGMASDLRAAIARQA